MPPVRMRYLPRAGRRRHGRCSSKVAWNCPGDNLRFQLRTQGRAYPSARLVDNVMQTKKISIAVQWKEARGEVRCHRGRTWLASWDWERERVPSNATWKFWPRPKMGLKKTTIEAGGPLTRNRVQLVGGGVRKKLIFRIFQTLPSRCPHLPLFGLFFRCGGKGAGKYFEKCGLARHALGDDEKCRSFQLARTFSGLLGKAKTNFRCAKFFFFNCRGKFEIGAAGIFPPEKPSVSFA